MKLGLGLGIGRAGGAVAAAPVALTAPVITRTSGGTTYPPTIDFTRPIDWFDGITAAMQRSQDFTFATGVTEATNTITAAVTSYNFGLSSVVSGSWFFRMAAWSGTRPGSLTWSNILNVGDVVAPTITSSNAVSVAERTGATANKLAHSLTANEGVTWAISGTDASSLELSGSTLRLAANADLNYETKTSYSVTITATDYAGNASTQALTITVTDVNENPTAFTFTDVASATVSTVYTSNTITIAGLPTGYAATLTYSGSGGYIKNGGSVATAATTVVNGDTIAVQLTSSASSATGVNGTVTIGDQAVPASDTYTVATAIASPLPQAASLGLWLDASDTTKLFQLITGATAVAADGDRVGTWKDGSTNTFDLVASANTTARPVWHTSGGVSWVEFDGSLNWLEHLGAALNLWSSSGYTAAIAMRSVSAGTGKVMLGQGHSTGSGEMDIFRTGTTATNDGVAYINDSGANVATGLGSGPAPSGQDGTDRVLILQDDGAGNIKVYLDGTVGTTVTYTRGANAITMNRFSLGCLRSTGANALYKFPGRVHGAAIWPGVQLTSGERATTLTYLGGLQGRTL